MQERRRQAAPLAAAVLGLLMFAGCSSPTIAPQERQTANATTPAPTTSVDQGVAAGTAWFNETAPDGSAMNHVVYACSAGFEGTRVDIAYWQNATAQALAQWLPGHGYVGVEVEARDPVPAGMEPRPGYVTHGGCPEASAA